MNLGRQLTTLLLIQEAECQIAEIREIDVIRTKSRFSCRRGKRQPVR